MKKIFTLLITAMLCIAGGGTVKAQTQMDCKNAFGAGESRWATRGTQPITTDDVNADNALTNSPIIIGTTAANVVGEVWSGTGSVYTGCGVSFDGYDCGDCNGASINAPSRYWGCDNTFFNLYNGNSICNGQTGTNQYTSGGGPETVVNIRGGALGSVTGQTALYSTGTNALDFSQFYFQDVPYIWYTYTRTQGTSHNCHYYSSGSWHNCTYHDASYSTSNSTGYADQGRILIDAGSHIHITGNIDAATGGGSKAVLDLPSSGTPYSLMVDGEIREDHIAAQKSGEITNINTMMPNALIGTYLGYHPKSGGQISTHADGGTILVGPNTTGQDKMLLKTTTVTSADFGGFTGSVYTGINYGISGTANFGNYGNNAVEVAHANTLIGGTGNQVGTSAMQIYNHSCNPLRFTTNPVMVNVNAGGYFIVDGREDVIFNVVSNITLTGSGRTVINGGNVRINADHVFAGSGTPVNVGDPSYSINAYGKNLSINHFGTAFSTNGQFWDGWPGTGSHCSNTGDIVLTGATATVSQTAPGNLLWNATQDIITNPDGNGSPVTFTISAASSDNNQRWFAGRNIHTGDDVTFTAGSAVSGHTEFHAQQHILHDDVVTIKHENTNPTTSNYVNVKAFDGNIVTNREYKVEIANPSLVTITAPNQTGHATNLFTHGTNKPRLMTPYENGSRPIWGAGNGNIHFRDLLTITRTNTTASTTDIIAGNNLSTAKVQYQSDNLAAETTNITSEMGDIFLGFNNEDTGKGYLAPPSSSAPYSDKVFNYVMSAPNATGKLNIKAGYQDATDNAHQMNGGNIYFTHIKEELGNTSNYNTEVSIPFSNYFYCGKSNDSMEEYEQAGIIGGVWRCQSIASGNNLCAAPGLEYLGGNGELLFDAGTRGNIIINNGVDLNFQDGTGNAKFLTRWGDIDMRDKFDSKQMKGSLLLLASSELPNKLNVRNDCNCAEPRNNVYMQDFKHHPHVDGGSVFIGADNNIKMQYGGLQSGTWAQARANTLDQFFNNRPYPCNTNKVHCDADTSQNQARDLILNFNGMNSGGMGMVASDLIDVYKNMIYTGGNGSGMGAVPTYNTLHGESVAGYGLYVKTQANKNNWAMSAHDLDNDPNPTVGAACYRGDCKGQFLHNVARITFHADARLYPENQRVLIASPVLNTYGNAEYNTTLNAGSKTNILVQADSLIYHDSLIIDGPKTQFTTWSNGMERNMPVIKLGHQRFTPPAAEGAPCPDCFTHKKDPRTRAGGNNKRLDSIFVTFRNDATIDRLHSLVSDHAIISFLTDSFDHTNGKPTQNAKFYTDIFKVRNHVELFTKPDHTTDGHFELCSEEQMATKDYAGVYARHLHMEPIAPTCSDFRFSQFWFPYPMLDVIPTSTFGGFGWIHADVHVEIGANLFPGFASLGKKGNCYEQRAGVLKMQDLRLDKGSNVKVSVGEDDAQNSFAETYTCPATFEKIELGRYADCLIVDSLSVYGTQYIDVEMRSGISLEPGQTKCYPIIQYKKVGKDNLNNLKLKKLQFTEKDHKSIDGTYYLTLDIDTVCKVVYLCVATIPEPVLERRVQIPAVSGVTSTPAAPGEYMVHSRHDFRFKLKFSTPHPLKVMTGRIVDGRPEEIFGWKNANGEFEYVIRRVQQDIVLEIGPGPATKTSTDEITGAAVWATDNKLYIRVDAEDIASVYSVTGQLVKQLSIPNGTTTTLLDPGVYIITLKDGSVHKVIVK